MQAERVEPSLLSGGAKRGDRERLRLAAREDRRPVRTRSHPNLDPDRPDLVGTAAVRALLVHCDPAADDVLLELVERELSPALLLGELLCLGIAAEGLEHLLLDALGGVLADELVLHL